MSNCSLTFFSCSLSPLNHFQIFFQKITTNIAAMARTTKKIFQPVVNGDFSSASSITPSASS